MADIQAQMTVCLESRENNLEHMYIICVSCVLKKVHQLICKDMANGYSTT